MDRNTGKPIGLIEHVAQSIEVILTTPTETRIMRLEFGNDGLQRNGLLKPDLSRADLEAKATAALKTYEPRVTFHEVSAIDHEGQVVGYRVNYDIKEAPGLRMQLVELPAYTA